MKAAIVLACTAALLAGQGPAASQAVSGPIALHPDNPHYFLWRGKPAVLITSGEHYGALLNLDFDYRKIPRHAGSRRHDVNARLQRRVCRAGGGVQIARNTLAPLPGRFISPWARSDQPGYANGGNRFDLGRWDEAYFSRLKDLAAYANAKGIVVELTLFCPMYEDKQWNLSPMNAAEQHQRRRERRPARRAHARQARRSARDPGSAHAQDRHRAEFNGQRHFRDHERAVYRRRADGLAAPHRRRDRRDRAGAAEEST